MRTPKRRERVKGRGVALKARRTFTLSDESVALLEELRAARRGARRRSLSAALDDLLRALHRQRKRDSVEQQIAHYYDELSSEAHDEEKAWGEFSLAQFMEGRE